MFNDNEVDLRNFMFRIVKMDGQFTSSFVLKRVRLVVTESYINSVEVEPTYCKLHLVQVAK